MVRSRAELAGLAGDWDRLASLQRRDGLFRGHAWNALWLEHIAPEATPHVIAVTGGDQGLVGLAPLCETVYRDRIFRLPSIGFTGRDVVTGDFLDILAAPGWEEVVRGRVLSHLETLLDRTPLLVLGELLDGEDTSLAVAAWAADRGRRARWQEERRCPYIELPATFEEYRRSLSRNMRSNLNRRTRQLLDEQGCVVERLRGPAAVLGGLEDLYRLHAARWESQGQVGTFVRPGFRSFLEAFVRTGAPLAESELYLLRHEGRAIASLLFFRWGDATLFYQGGWDPASPCARLSPNLVLFARAIADAIDDGCRTFEFLQGEEAYKWKFASAERRTRTLLVAGRGPRARLYFAAMHAKDRLKGVLRRDG